MNVTPEQLTCDHCKRKFDPRHEFFLVDIDGVKCSECIQKELNLNKEMEEE